MMPASNSRQSSLDRRPRSPPLGTLGTSPYHSPSLAVNGIQRTSSPLKRAIGESADEGARRSKRATSPYGSSIPYVDQPNMIRSSRAQQVGGGNGQNLTTTRTGYRRSSSAVSPHLHRNKSSTPRHQTSQIFKRDNIPDEGVKGNKQKQIKSSLKAESESDDDFGEFRTFNVWRKSPNKSSRGWQYEPDSDIDDLGDDDEEEEHCHIIGRGKIPVTPTPKSKVQVAPKKIKSTPLVHPSIAISAKITEIKANMTSKPSFSTVMYSSAPNSRSSSTKGLPFQSMNVVATDARTSDLAVECQFSVEERGRSREALRKMVGKGNANSANSDTEPNFMATPPPSRPPLSPLPMPISRRARQQLQVPIPSKPTAIPSAVPSSYSSPPLTPPQSSPGSYFSSRTTSYTTTKHSYSPQDNERLYERPSLTTYTSFEHDFNMKPPASPANEEQDKKKGWWGR